MYKCGVTWRCFIKYVQCFGHLSRPHSHSRFFFFFLCFGMRKCCTSEARLASSFMSVFMVTVVCCLYIYIFYRYGCLVICFCAIAVNTDPATVGIEKWGVRGRERGLLKRGRRERESRGILAHNCGSVRAEERRVGKECRARLSPEYLKKK